MGLVSSLVDLATGGALGGLTGLVGTTIGAVVKHKDKKADQIHELAMADAMREDRRMEAETAMAIEEARADVEEKRAETSSYIKSVESSMKPLFSARLTEGLPRWARLWIGLLMAHVDALRALMRPGLTIYFTAAISMIAYSTYQEDPKGFVAASEQIAFFFIYAASSATMWWFGDRQLSKLIAANKKRV